MLPNRGVADEVTLAEGRIRLATTGPQQRQAGRVQIRGDVIRPQDAALDPAGSLRYDDRTGRKPLIDQVSNKWRDEKAIPSHYYYANHTEDEPGTLRFCDLEDDDSCPNISTRLSGSRRSRRMFLFIMLATALLFAVWTRYLQPRWREEWDLAAGFTRRAMDGGTYGLARGGDFHLGKERIATLDPALVPGGDADPHGRRRLVFVGDIHGCRQELRDLLDKVSFDPERDHLVATGDVISKGPDNIGVLDELLRLGATSVRGNHEDRILAVARSVLGSAADEEEDEREEKQQQQQQQQPVPPASVLSHGAAKDAALLRQLHPRHLRFLRAMPLVLRIGPLPRAAAVQGRHRDDTVDRAEILVVHAGLVPGVPLARQDPYFVMNMRSLQPRTHVPSTVGAGREARGDSNRPWTQVWEWYSARLARGRGVRVGWREWVGGFWKSGNEEEKKAEVSSSRPQPQVVVFGHDSKAGLQIGRWSKGLDSACVAGGQLTAMVLDAEGKTELVSVGCRNYRD